MEVNRDAPAAGRKAALFATCFVNYNNPEIGLATRAVLAWNGVDTDVAYPGCCGMPQLKHGDVARVAEHAARIAAALSPSIEDGRLPVGPAASGSSPESRRPFTEGTCHIGQSSTSITVTWPWFREPCARLSPGISNEAVPGKKPNIVEL